MNGATHERALDRYSIHKGVGQRRALEVAQPRPQSDVAARRVLRLQAADSLQRARQLQVRSFEQQLPCQKSAVQLTCGEDAFAQRAILDRRES